MQDFNSVRSNALFSIDLSGIKKNLVELTKKVKNVMPMVKANAYGTDALRLSKFYQACKVPMIGVSHTKEGVFLREKGITIPIFVIHVPAFEAHLAARYDLDAAVSTFDEASALSEAGNREKKRVRVHLSINTGMNRFGVDPSKAIELAHFIHDLPFLEMEGVMTHFACSDRPDLDAFTYQQISTFRSIVDKLNPKPKWIHAANSPGAVRFDLPFCNLARIGIALFGVAAPLTPTLTLESHLVSVMEAKKGEWVGYSCRYQVQKENFRIGIIPLGYHDGWHRHYSEKGFVLIHEKKAPMIGHVCMDYMMVDLTEIPEANVFDKVVLFNSRDLTPDMVASWGNTDVRELLACLGPRVKRAFILHKPRKKKDQYSHERSTERLSIPFESFEKSTPIGKCLPSS